MSHRTEKEENDRNCMVLLAFILAVVYFSTK